jgi:heme exporter protein A
MTAAIRLRPVALSRVADPGSSRTDLQTKSPAVDLRGVTRVFGATPALVRADLAVTRGQVVLVRGPNGAGKTTLLRVVATAISPTYGGGTVLGVDLVSGREEIRRRTELVGHRTRLYGDLTAAENLRFACALYGLDPELIHPALERVGLSRAADRRAGELSQGMRQRVALARAVLRRPDLLLLDDPATGLDAAAREVLAGLVEEARTEGRTVIFSAHERDAGTLATREVRMEGGRVLP